MPARPATKMALQSIELHGLGADRSSISSAAIAHLPQPNFPIIKFGKPPALPGDSARFDLYVGRPQSPQLDQEQGERNARVRKFESYEVGLQISRCVHPEAAQEDDIRSAEEVYG